MDKQMRPSSPECIQNDSPHNYEALWIQFNHKGELCLRIVVKGTHVPTGAMNASPLKFVLRASERPYFPVRVWEVTLPRERGNKIEIEGHSLFLPPHQYKKIVLIGDTGCRPTQSTSSEHWPLRTISSTIFHEHPDLMIHLGDYIYRHASAQQKFSSNHLHPREGDTWFGWQQEFFNPLQNLLPVAPWIFVRGNQECYDRASEGWRMFLDPYPYRERCSLYNPAYVIPLDTIDLIVHDSSLIDPIDYPQIFPRHQLKEIQLSSHKKAWLLTHRPPWGLVETKGKEGLVLVINEHRYLQKFLKPYPKNLTAIFSGHIHAFQAIKLSHCDIWQYVIGNSGVCLEEDAPPEVIDHTRIDHQNIDHALSLVKFGYGVAEYVEKGWAFSAKDKEGQPLASTYRL